jgi:hypothetical protein
VASEEFVLAFGQVDGLVASGSGRIVRSLVEGMITLPDRETFEQATAAGASASRAAEDRKGFITWKGESGGSAVRVFRPALIRRVEDDWMARGGLPGRWVQAVRGDGTPAADLQFVEFSPAQPEAIWGRVRDASRRLASDLGPLGLLARVQAGRWVAGENYVNAWAGLLESGEPGWALHGTVEVRTLSGRPIGLVVTPLHPLRFAWTALYDGIVAHARYEQGMSAADLQRELQPVDSAFFPLALPGVGEGPAFVFADMLGFHTLAMTVEGEPEPKSAVAVMSTCVSGGRAITPSIGTESATVLAREMRHFLQCHGGVDGQRPDMLNLQAWRAGDGMTVARALGQVLRAETAEDGEDETPSPLCFALDLYYPAESGPSGRFLATAGQRRRSGGGVLEADDRWMAETAPRPGGVLLPRLRWAKRREPASPGPVEWAQVRASHLALIFDIFETRLEARPASGLGSPRPLHAHGLIRAVERRVDLGEDPEWMVFAAPELSGEPAPDGRAAGDRLRRLDRAVARLTAKALGGEAEKWPVLVTRLPPPARARIDRLHERSDWVVTVDRNAGLEYFDAPHQQGEVYERFVIDAVPERADLGATRLVTSTTNLDAVRDLVDEALGEMGLSSSERNSRFLIGQLKTLSGRLAIRLANAAGRTGELIALALMQANCAQKGASDSNWLDLTQGFFVPVDEIGDFARIVRAAGEEGESGRRADFIHVSAPTRGPLEFRFVEVKHRLHLRTARQPELLSQMLRQTGDLRQRWMGWFFGERSTTLQRSVRSSQLARLLRFYADRAARHHLTSKVHGRLCGEIDALVWRGDYRPGDVSDADIGYVFCPELRNGAVEPLYAPGGEDAKFRLFGPALLPDERAAASVYAPEAATPIPADSAGDQRMAPASGAAPEAREAPIPEASEHPPATTSAGIAPEPTDPVDVVLGEAPGGALVEWRVSIRSNPHLMMVGLPGMGKTTALISIGRQLAGAGIAPVVFSYHEDIDAKLAQALGPLHTVDFEGMGFNPLQVDATGATAHVDVAGTLRDIFGSIFPDLGDLQLEELRQAIKKSYDDLGWGVAQLGPERPPTPPFQAFFDILKTKQRPNLNLLARLQELADYGFFASEGSGTSPLSHEKPTLVRIHATTNGLLQNAFAAFVLYSMYKGMFRRGVQERITHAVIFDEAHRAAKLKLIPRFAKECRKYGLALVLASQGAKDFDSSLYEAVGSYVILRVTEADARTLARNAGATADQQRTSDRLKGLEPYHALFFGATANKPRLVHLLP